MKVIDNETHHKVDTIIHSNLGLRGESVENIDFDFLVDLASLGSKLMREKKTAKFLSKVVPQGRIKEGVQELKFD